MKRVLIIAVVIISPFILTAIFLLFLPYALRFSYIEGDFTGLIQWWIIRIRMGRKKVWFFCGSKAIYKIERERVGDWVEEQVEETVEDFVEEIVEPSISGGKESIAHIIRNRRLLLKLAGKTLSMLKRIITGFEIRKFMLEIRSVSLEPALTGFGYGIFYGFLKPYLPTNSEVIYEPFGVEKKRNKVDLMIRMYLYRLLWEIFKFILSIPKFQTIRFVKTLKRKGRKRPEKKNKIRGVEYAE
ncbi:MAG: hypothetical protein GY855_04915 [candidate division Zixibacteria bacterium]|nr:hypothetical protein [candidate division Zixibacteria bacterium]